MPIILIIVLLVLFLGGGGAYYVGALDGAALITRRTARTRAVGAVDPLAHRNLGGLAIR